MNSWHTIEVLAREHRADLDREAAMDPIRQELRSARPRSRLAALVARLRAVRLQRRRRRIVARLEPDA